MYEKTKRYSKISLDNKSETLTGTIYIFDNKAPKRDLTYKNLKSFVLIFI